MEGVLLLTVGVNELVSAYCVVGKASYTVMD